MEAQFELHRTDHRPFHDGEGDQIFTDAIARTRYDISLNSVTQANGSVIGTIQLHGRHQYYRLQLVLTELQKVPNIHLRYGGSRN